MVTHEPSPFIRSIIDIYHSTGFVGEDQNIIKVFLSATSRHLPAGFRVHIVVFSQSGAGKTTLLKRVLEPFNNDVKQYSRFTGAALDRMEESLDGKVFLYEQLQGFESSNLKVLLSEGELRILVVEKGADGKLTSMEKTLNGMPVFMTTSTTEVDAEMLNRVLPLSMDESEDQSRRILAQQAREFSHMNYENKNHRWAPLLALDKVYEETQASTITGIKIPFIESMAENMPLPLTIRRDFKRLLTLVQIIAFAKLYNPATGHLRRPVIELSDVEGVSSKIIIALPEDLDDAVWCFGGNLSESIHHMFGRAKEIIDILVKKQNAEGVSVRDIAVEMKGIAQKTIYNYLEMLVAANLATKEKRGRANGYFPTSNEMREINLSADFSLEECRKWIDVEVGERAKKVFIPEEEMFRRTPEVVTPPLGRFDGVTGRSSKAKVGLLDAYSDINPPESPINGKSGFYQLNPPKPNELPMNQNGINNPPKSPVRGKSPSNDLPVTPPRSPQDPDTCAKCHQTIEGILSLDPKLGLVCDNCQGKDNK